MLLLFLIPVFYVLYNVHDSISEHANSFRNKYTYIVSVCSKIFIDNSVKKKKCLETTAL